MKDQVKRYLALGGMLPGEGFGSGVYVRVSDYEELEQRCRELKAEKQKIADELVSFIHKEHAQVCAERDWLRSEVEQLKKDAERYRWLREQTWDSAYLCVVVRPKDAVKLGHDCPSGNRLDTKIDAAMVYE